MSLSQQDIIMNHPYIIMKKINNLPVEQVVIIDNSKQVEKGILYEYTYGVYNFHDGCAFLPQIRKLTPHENDLYQNNKFWKLPQQFYQT